MAKRERVDPLARAMVDGKLDPKKAVETVNALMRIGLMRMNRIQEPFIRIKNKQGRTPRRRILETGEKTGKCISFNTLVETPSGEKMVGSLFREGRPFDVYAWDGDRKVIARASAPFRKPGLHQCYRVELASGRWIEAADEHRVMLCDGTYQSISQLHAFFLSLCLNTSSETWRCEEEIPSPLVSTLESGLLILPSGALCLSGKPSSCQESYSPCFHRYGGPPQSEEDSVPTSSPSRDDARKHYLSLCSEDDRDNTHTSTPLISFSLPASETHSDLYHRFVDSSQPPIFDKIVRFYLIGISDVYDFEVAGYHNYYAAGMIHHNTRIGITEDIAHAMGFRPWLEESDPDYKIPVRIPNHGLIGCETMAQSVEAKIRPELEALIPQHCGPQWKNDTTGALKSVTLKYDYAGKLCGSTMHIRSYNQPADSFRGIDPDWNHWDEPPPRDILIASERGKVVTNAPSWFTMTPLKEAYIYDMFSVKAFNNGGMDQEIAVFHGSMWDNCQDWCRQCGLYIPENDPANMSDPHAERPKNKCPNCGQVMGFIPRSGIDEYLKLFTDPDELAAHIEGKYAHLSGLVYKELNREVHIVKDFRIPENWMRIEAVDPHDARPTRWLFAAVSPEDITINGKPASRIYIYAYLLASGNIDEIARQVKVKRAEHNYQTPAFVVLDAKYGARVQKSMDGDTSWEEELLKAGIERIRLSHSEPGDISLGHKRVKEYLRAHYSAVKGKDIPALLFLEDGCRGDRGPTQDMSNYQWKPGTDKPEEAYKDFCDCVRYLALEQPVYEAPRREMDVILELMSKRENESYNPLGYGLRGAQ